MAQEHTFHKILSNIENRITLMCQRNYEHTLEQLANTRFSFAECHFHGLNQSRFKMINY